MQVIILEGKDLERIAADPSGAGLILTEMLRERATLVMQHKESQLALVD